MQRANGGANPGDGARNRGNDAPPPDSCESCPAHTAAFCAEVADNSIERLDQSVRRISFAKGQFVAEEGEPNPGLMTVISGAVRLYRSLSDGRRQVTGFRYRGELVMPPCRDLPSPVSVQAIEPSVICLLDQEDLDALRQADSALTRRLDELIARMMTADVAHMMTLGRKSPAEKLASFLLEMSGREFCGGDPGDPVALPMSRQDIADYLGLECETTSRFFTRFKHGGMIALPQPNRVVMRDQASLATLATGQGFERV